MNAEELLAKLRAALGQLRAAARRLAARRPLAAALRDTDPAARPVLLAVQAAVRGDESAEERAWFARLDALRRELRGDQTPLRFMDYGAVDPGLSLPAEEMAAGREVSSRVDRLGANAKSPFWGGLLYRLVRAQAPRRSLELGTQLGMSAAYLGGALEANGAGTLVTLEGAESVAAVAEQNLAKLGLRRVRVVVGRFADTLPAVLGAIEELDFVFVDGHHDHDATLAYFAQLLLHAAPGALLVFDDIAWSPGMRRAWEQIAAHPRMAVALDLGAVGVCRVGEGGAGTRPLRLRIPLA